tara:strand:+ start:3440 stop:4003 length:564 start_codon:yes stop_codon:yes gene_type:complete
MATQVQFRRGTTSQNDSFTGAVGELSLDTDTESIRIHDGSTAGGFEVIPSGAIMGFGGATIPANYLICDGSAVSRSTYAHLFATIGTAFGAGDSNTTFNVPDFRDKLALGKGANNSTLGATTHAMSASSVKPSESTSLSAHSLTTATFATSAKDSSTSSAVTAVAAHSAITPNMTFPTVVVNFIIKT